MGTRALVALMREGGYDLYRVQYDGLALESWIDELDPSPTDIDDLSLPDADWQPVRTAASVRDLRTVLAPGLDEALYVVDEDGSVTGFAVIVLAVDPTAASEHTPGILAQPSGDGLSALVRRVEGARAALLALGSSRSARGDQSDADDRLDAAFERAIEDWAVRTIRLDAITDGTF